MSAAARLMIVLRTILSAIGDYLTRTVSLFWIGPAVVALVVIPEFAQHVAEIHLGMFDSLEKGRALAEAPLRMGFGYVKLTGLALTFFASARFWWCRDRRGRWYDIRRIAWLRFVSGFIAFFAVGLTDRLIPLLSSHEAPIAVSVLFNILSFPFLFVMIAGLFGDRSTPLRDLLLRSWPWLLLLVLLAPLGFAPLSWLHGMNHRWALGGPDALVWALMIFDSLVVGLMASSVGAAMFVAYDRFRQGIAAPGVTS
jgi:hypothetical protein